MTIAGKQIQQPGTGPWEGHGAPGSPWLRTPPAGTSTAARLPVRNLPPATSTGRVFAPIDRPCRCRRNSVTANASWSANVGRAVQAAAAPAALVVTTLLLV